MPTGIQVSGSILVGTQKPTDARYGPYASTSAALSDLTPVYRYKGLTVGIETGGVITEYWFNDGIQDTDFVVKSLDPNADIATSGIDTTTGSPVLTTADRVLYNNNSETVATFATNFDLRKPLEFGGTSGAANAATSRTNLGAESRPTFSLTTATNEDVTLPAGRNQVSTCRTVNFTQNRNLTLPRSNDGAQHGDRIQLTHLSQSHLGGSWDLIVRQYERVAPFGVPQYGTGFVNLITLRPGDSVHLLAEDNGILTWSVIPQVLPDWNETDSTQPDFIKNKPTNFTGSNGTVAGISGFVPAPAATDNTKFLKGDGTWADVTGATQVQADWNETDNTQPDFIKNKPTVPDTGFTIAMALAL